MNGNNFFLKLFLFEKALAKNHAIEVTPFYKYSFSRYVRVRETF